MHIHKSHSHPRSNNFLHNPVTQEVIMFKVKSARIIGAGWLCVLLLVSSAMAGPKHCAPVGGTFMTNVGGFGNNTTLGVITGDIKGAAGVEILQGRHYHDYTPIIIFRSTRDCAKTIARSK